MMGRPAKYRNAGERQKAYRERQKQKQLDENPYVALIAEVLQQVETLRNTAERLKKRGEKPEFYVMNTAWSDSAVIRSGGNVRNPVNSLIIRHMIRTGELVESSRDMWGGVIYQFKEHMRTG